MTPEQAEILDRALDALDSIADSLKEFIRLVEQEIEASDDA